MENEKTMNTNNEETVNNENVENTEETKAEAPKEEKQEEKKPEAEKKKIFTKKNVIGVAKSVGLMLGGSAITLGVLFLAGLKAKKTLPIDVPAVQIPEAANDVVPQIMEKGADLINSESVQETIAAMKEVMKAAE